MNNKLKLNRSEGHSYMSPEGCFFSRFHSHDTGPDKNGEIKLRLRYELDVPGSNGLPFMAGRTINPLLVEGSDLYWFLKPWIGEERLTELMVSGANFDTLIGTTGWATIEHIDNNQPKPYVYLESVVAERPESDSITVNVPKLVKAVMLTASTRTVTQAIPAAVPVERTITASASTCPYCGAEVNKFGSVR